MAKKVNYKRKVYDVRIKNKDFGFSFLVKSNFDQVSKKAFKNLNIKDNTLYSFVINKFLNFHVILMAEAVKDFDAYMRFTENKLRKDGFEVYLREKLSDNKYQLILSKKDLYFMNYLMIINGYVINFAINLRNIKKKDFSNERKILDNITDSIKVFDPERRINIPDVIETLDVLKQVDENSLRRRIVEEECKYKNIKVPRFYFKYTYYLEDRVTLLNINDDEIYYSGFTDCFRFFKKDNRISLKIEDIVNKYKVDLMKNLSEENLSNSYLSIKLNDEYFLIDLLKDNDKKLNYFFKEVLDVLKEAFNFDFYLYQVLPKKYFISNEKLKSYKELDNKVNLKKEVKINKSKEDKEEKKKDDKKEESKKETNEEKKIEIKDIKKEEKKTEEKDIPQEEFKKDLKEKADKILKEVKEKKEEVVEDIVEINNQEFKAPILPDVVVKEEIKEEEVIIETKEDDSTKEELEPIETFKKEEVKYDYSDYHEMFHNLGRSLYKFMVPNNYLEKKEAAENIFDIKSFDEEYFRIFIYPCKNQDEYYHKLTDWMLKNQEDSGGDLEYKRENINDKEIETYILANNKYYQTVYLYNSLISISSDYNQDNYQISSAILDSFELINDQEKEEKNKLRKDKSNKFLSLMGLPKIDDDAIYTYENINLKAKDDILKRAIILTLISAYANDLLDKKSFFDYFKTNQYRKEIFNYGLEGFLSEKEEELLKEKEEDLAIELTWSIESAYILFYIIGLIDFNKVLSFNEKVEQDEILRILEEDTYNELLEKADLIDIDELLDMADLITRIKKVVDENEEEYNEFMDKDLVSEREKAIRWALKDISWNRVE